MTFNCCFAMADSFTGTSEVATAAFNIKYEIPFKNASRDLNLPSSTSFSNFLIAVAAKMETRVTLLTSIGYIPSYRPKTPKPVPKLLEDEDSYEAMMDDVDEFIATCKAKKRGKGDVKPFCIRIIDTSEAPVGTTKVTRHFNMYIWTLILV